MDEFHHAINPNWKVSLIPKEAGNATEPTYASTSELEAIIDNPSSLQLAQPIENQGLTPAPRYNANVPYSPQTIIYSMDDQILMQAIRLAVKNGWKGYTRFANDAVTIGMEAESVVLGMKKQHANVNSLLLDKYFNRCLWGSEWDKRIKQLVMVDNPIKYLESFLGTANK